MEFTLKKDTEFAQDVLEGLSAKDKFLSSKYFYDHLGDKLFQKIMELPEYYLTRTEFTILQKYHGVILDQIMGGDDSFNLVELGAGDGLKTKILLDYLYQAKRPFTYFPIDISGSVLKHLQDDLNQSFPDIDVCPIESNYKKALAEKAWQNGKRTLLLFLGANIGNFVWQEAREMLSQVAASLSKGDLMLIGFDLKKDPELILSAYDDANGVTRDFNLNILSRINKELGGNFDLNNFKHWPVYNPVTGECKSYLVSTVAQEISISALNRTFTFKKAEAIHTEISKKYDPEEICELAEACGFEVLRDFEDDQGFFTDSLWIKR
ncbi:L-histidine N(alpha)-methyltransferase [Echinicola sediminis]